MKFKKKDLTLEAKYLVDKEDLEDVKDELDTDDTVKVVGEAVDGSEVVEYAGEMKGEKPFKFGDVVYQYVWANYPDGKKDIGIYVKSQDIVYSKDWFLTNVINPIQDRKTETLRENINPELLSRFKEGKCSLEGNPSLPSNDVFVEALNDGFNKVVKELRASKGVDSLDYPLMVEEITNCVSDIKEMEREHGDLLLDMAKNVVCEEFGMDGDEIDFDLSLGGEIDESNDPYVKQPSEYTHTDYEEIEGMDNEVHKRRMINAINHGGAKSLTSIIYRCYDKLKDINPKLCKSYSDLMPMANYQYYKSDELPQDSRSGSLAITLNDNKPKMTCKGTILPALLNQMIKGILEILTFDSLPEDKEKRDYVISRADYGEAEADDIRIGEGIYDKINGLIPDEDLKYKHLLIKQLSNLTPIEFHDIMRNILANTQKGQDYVGGAVTEIKESITNFDTKLSEQKEKYLSIDDIDSLEF